MQSCKYSSNLYGNRLSSITDESNLHPRVKPLTTFYTFQGHFSDTDPQWVAIFIYVKHHFLCQSQSI